jgi:RNA polymerase sigma-70 factor (ECF subfamily)
VDAPLDQNAIEAVYRNEAGRVLATLIRLVGDFELAEEGAQDAFEAALARWPQTGLPSNTRAWLVNTGRHKAIDRLRRRVVLRGKLKEIVADTAIAEDGSEIEPDDIEDDRLRLIFTCCHPALALETRVALTLRVVCGLPTTAIARSFLVAEDAMARRLVRAKAKIREAGIPYNVPGHDLLAERLAGVLAVVYLVFTEGYAPSTGERATRPELCAEAVRLGRLLNALLPDEPEVAGLLALMLLHAARLDGRSDGAGELLLLEEQNRSAWDRVAIAEGKALVERALRQPRRVGPYGVQGAIAALHADAASFAETDWPQIVGLYQVLLHLQPSPVVELNAAAALSMVDGPERALQLIDALAASGTLDDYWPFHAARADLLRRMDRPAEAKAGYLRALALVKLPAERRLLERQVVQMEEAPPNVDK